MPSKYSDGLKDKILVLWNANTSAQNIADRFGLTKSMVVSMIGKMRKKGLHVRSGKINNRNPYKAPRSPRNRKRVSPQVPIIHKPPITFRSTNRVQKSSERWVPLLHLNDNTCRYTKDSKTFCNAPSNGSYCEEHLRFMYSGYHSLRVSLRSFSR